MTQHTPGPWWNDGHGYVRAQSDDSTIAKICDDDEHCDGPQPMPVEANGDLIAAAPDLLAACKGLLDAIHDSMTHAAQAAHAEQIDAARAAIASAEGGGQ